jgi:hypothetical protein
VNELLTYSRVWDFSGSRKFFDKTCDYFFAAVRHPVRPRIKAMAAKLNLASEGLQEMYPHAQNPTLQINHPFAVSLNRPVKVRR